MRAKPGPDSAASDPRPPAAAAPPSSRLRGWLLAVLVLRLTHAAWAQNPEPDGAPDSASANATTNVTVATNVTRALATATTNAAPPAPAGSSGSGDGSRAPDSRSADAAVVAGANPPANATTSRNRTRRNASRPRGDAASPQPAERAAGTDYAGFKILSERNIFNPNRSARAVRENRPERKQPKVDSFTLVGIMGSEKGWLAFFDGSSADLRKALKPAETIAGFRVDGISATQVTLVAQTNASTQVKDLALRPGFQMRREDDGEWQLIALPTSLPNKPSLASADSDATTDGAADGEDSEILKRLIKKRQKEMEQ